MFNSDTLSTEQFLADYWQKKPLLIRQAFPGFEPLLDAGDIAGLACDEMAESRLVTGSFPQHDWQLRYGPFTEEDFQSLPEKDWTFASHSLIWHGRRVCNARRPACDDCGIRRQCPFPSD